MSIYISYNKVKNTIINKYWEQVSVSHNERERNFSTKDNPALQGRREEFV